MVFSIITNILNKHHHYTLLEHSHLLNKKLHIQQQSLLIFHSPSHWQPLVDFLSLWLCLFWTSHTSGITHAIFWVWLLSFTITVALGFICGIAWVIHSFLLVNNSPLHGSPCIIYPFTSWWTLKLFPLFSYYEWCCYEHLCTSFCVKKWFQFS